MTSRRARRRTAPKSGARDSGIRRIAGLALIGAAGAAVIVAIAVIRGVGQASEPRPWAHLGTEDVHALAFPTGSTDHIIFGHHGGILESRDGGRSWNPVALRQDAMTVRPAADGSIFVAGHDVFVASRDGGATWQDVDADLPNLDIHAFARDPADPDRMWAYLAEGGVYESQDGGRSWDLVFDDHVPQLVPVVTARGTDLIGLDPFAGITRSTDGGRTWQDVSRPPSAPVVSLAATPDGAVTLVGVDDGVYRSADGARTWSRVLDVALPLALAVSDDAGTIVAVSRATDFYRSDDGGRTWPGPP